MKPEIDDDGFCYIPEHTSVGINAGPVLGAMGILAGIISARATGEGVQMEIAQSDAAVATDWLRSETWKAYERPEDVVTGNKADNYERRAPGTGGMKEGVRYQMYESADGHILFMASEQAFWKKFCDSIGRSELFEQWPGSKYADHARGNKEPFWRRSTRPRRWPTTPSSRTASRGSPTRPTARTCCRRRSR